MRNRFLALCLLGIFPFGAMAKPTKEEPVPCFLPRPVNVIPNGSLADGDECPEWPSSEKKQYAPVNDDQPILSEKKSEPSYEAGTYYEEGDEMYIDPASGVKTTSDVIEDDPKEPEKPEQK